MALEQMGKSLVVVEADKIEQKDFTNGEATKRYIDLKNSGAAMVKNNEEVLGGVLFARHSDLKQQ